MSMEVIKKKKTTADTELKKSHIGYFYFALFQRKYYKLI